LLNFAQLCHFCQFLFMADTATIQTQNAADVGNQKPVNAGGGNSKTEKIIIGKPFTMGGRADNVIKFIQIDGGPRMVSGWKVRNGSKVEVFGKGLDRYNQVALWIGGGRELISGGDVRQKVGGEGLEFTARFGTNLYAKGLPIEVEFLEYNRPDNDRTLERHFTYRAESKEEAEKRKAREAAGGAGGSNGGASGSPGPTAMMLGAMGDVFKGVLNSTTGASSAGTKTISQSGTASQPVANQVSAEVADEGGGGEVEEEYVQETGGGEVSSTSEISTGGQTVSESGTVSSGGQTVRESGTVTSTTATEVRSSGTVEQTGQISQTQAGTAGTTTTINTGGTVQTSGSVNVSGGVSSTSEVSATMGGTLRSSATQQASSGGGASGTADISRRVVSTGGTNDGGGTVTGRSAISGTQSAGGGVNITGTIKDDVNLSAKAEVKADVRADETSDGKISAQTQGTGSSSAPPQASPTIGGGGTAGMGAGLPTFGGGTTPSAPASLGRMKQNDAARNLNIASGGTGMPSTMPPVAGKPAQGGAGAPGSADKKAAAPGVDAAKPPAKPDQTNPNKLPAVPSAEQPGGKTEPGDEARPPSEAPPGTAGAPTGGPNDEKKVSPPLGPDALNRHPDNQQSPDNNQGGGANQAPDKGQPSSATPGAGGGGLAAMPPQGGEPQPPGSPGGSSAGQPGPTSAQNRNPRNVFQDPRKSAEENPFREKNNPAAYPTVRRLIDKNSELAEKGLAVGGKTTSKIWYYGFGSSCATFFTGLDFMLGAIVMDAYWIFGHRKNKDLFPLKGWQKIVTIAANIIPPILIVLILAFIMVAGCNWPIPIRTSAGNNYSLTVVGHFIGDDCKYFDISNVISSGTNTTSGGQSAPTQTTSPTTGPVTPR